MSAYEAVSKFYGDKKARRSGIPLMNHINESLKILSKLNVDNRTKDAFCLHPLFQNDHEFHKRVEEGNQWWATDARTMMLVLEYRHRANNWLSDKVKLRGGKLTMIGAPDPGTITQVKWMLIADKVQNYKDFMRYNAGHRRAEQLDKYFKEWFKVLEVDNDLYDLLVEGL